MPSSARVCVAKNRASRRLVVSSQAVAFAPFSQNSATSGCGDLAQAQLTQVKPPGLFCT